MDRFCSWHWLARSGCCCCAPCCHRRRAVQIECDARLLQQATRLQWLLTLSSALPWWACYQHPGVAWIVIGGFTLFCSTGFRCWRVVRCGGRSQQRARRGFAVQRRDVRSRIQALPDEIAQHCRCGFCCWSVWCFPPRVHLRVEMPTLSLVAIVDERTTWWPR